MEFELRKMGEFPTVPENVRRKMSRVEKIVAQLGEQPV